MTCLMIHIGDANSVTYYGVIELTEHGLLPSVQSFDQSVSPVAIFLLWAGLEERNKEHFLL